jgi:lipoprotein-anchoring transpeptidase ErfK/SrfK
MVAMCSFAASSFSAAQDQRRSARPAPKAPTAPVDPTLAGLTEALPTLDDKMRRGLALQVALDRAGFSPGEIDGAPGVNTDRAMAAFKGAKGTSELDDGYANPVVNYTITAEDTAGPFVERIPEDMMEKSTLPALAYRSVVELLSERFHANPKLLQRLNPGSQFTRGEVITVPNVEPFVAPAAKGAAQPQAVVPPAAKGAAQPPAAAVTVTVTDRTKTLQVENAAGEVVMHAPVTVGSENDPLPIGEWKVEGVSRNPVFNYNPKLFWDAEPSHAKAKIPAGPNSPVGVVWIDLSKDHYGIHGTPEPSRIGYTESHGCIRLTNWDAARLADLVGPGTKVVLR